MTRMEDGPHEWSPNNSLVQSIKTEDWIKQDVANKIDSPATSVIQSVGHPTSSSHHGEQNHNLDYNFLKATKESSDDYVPTSKKVKRKLENEIESKVHLKKKCYIQGTEIQSTDDIFPFKTKHVLHVSDTDGSLSTERLLQLFFNPSISQYIISIFERFPFASFEKKSLASILKHCYQFKDSVTEYIDFHKKTEIDSQSGTHTDHHNVSDSDRSLVTVLSDPPSPDMQCYTATLKYDTDEMDDLFDKLMDAHKRYVGNTLTFMSESEMNWAQDTFWGLCQFKEMVHGKMKFIDDDKYYTILETTGIDVDKRREYLMTYLNTMNASITKMIKFFRAVPGFEDFTMADKTTLTKSCTCNYYLLTKHRGIDTNKGISIDEETGTAVRFSHMGQLFPKLGIAQPQLNEIISEIKKLKLSLEEIVVLKALVLTNPDTDQVLVQPEIVAECHKIYTKCLLNLMRKRHGSTADDRFATIAGILFQKFNNIRDLRKVFISQLSEGISRMVDRHVVPLVNEACLHGSKSERDNELTAIVKLRN